MKKFPKLIFVLALLFPRWSLAMEEPENEISSLEIAGLFANELWIKILSYAYFDRSIVIKSSDIFEAVKKIERLYSAISMTCVIFHKIEEEFKRESITFYRKYLKEYFLEPRNLEVTKLVENQFITSVSKGLYPLKDTWKIAGTYNYLDNKIAQFMYTNIDDGILTYILSSIDESDNKVKDVCCLLIFFGADINAKDDQGNIALNLTIKFNPGLILMFIAKGADINIEDPDLQNEALNFVKKLTKD